MTEPGTMKAGWGGSFIRWRELVPVLISMVVVGGALFAFVLKLHANSPHEDAASISEIQKIDNRIDRIEKRSDDRLRRIEDKLDKLLGGRE